MTDQEKKEESTNITPQPDAENKKQSGELSEEELKKTAGGTEFLQIKMSNVTVSH